MSLPNAALAAVETPKVRDYLLSESHSIGRFKAAFFNVLGYTVDDWELLRDDLLAIARDHNAVPGKPSPFGKVFLVDGILTGPSGRVANVRTVWMIRNTEDIPRFVTAFPR